MKPSNLQFRLEGYRAIHKACIDLEGMTVLTGPGGSGKSTLLKYLYRLLSGINTYENWAREIPNYGMMEIEDNIYNLVYWVFPYEHRKYMKDPSLLRSDMSIPAWIKLLAKLKDLSRLSGKQTIEINGKMKFMDNQEQIKTLLEKMEIEVSPEEMTFPEFIELVEVYLHQLQEKSSEILTNRPADYFYAVMKDIREWKPENEFFSLQEKGVTILDKEQQLLGKLTRIKQVYYINEEQKIYLQSSGKRKNLPKYESIIQRIKEIIQGDIYVKEIFNEEIKKKETKYIYHRKDGKEFPLNESEASLKPFFFLYKLVMEGRLNDKTLLIFDQPGVVLGSARIIQFACLACQIQKELKTKFIFATDLQEMTAALDAAAQGYGLGKRFKLYEAREVDESFTYEYHQII